MASTIPALRAVCDECVQVLSLVPLPLLVGFVIITLIGVIILAYTLLFILAPVPRDPFPQEKTYRTISKEGSVTSSQQLPCWRDNLKPGLPNNDVVEIEEPDLFMSVVIPAYNEEDRLTGMLEEAVNYLEHAYGARTSSKEDPVTKKNNTTALEASEKGGTDGRRRTRKANNNKPNTNLNGTAVTLPTDSDISSLKGWEVLVISDGSTDKTVQTALGFAKDHQLSIHPKGHDGPWTHVSGEGVNIPSGTIRVVHLDHNRGKGGAVTHGMRHVRGQYVVFADADGASNFTDLGKLVTACQKSEDSKSRCVAVGSRAHLVGSDVVVKRSKLRNFLMHSFHLALRLLTPPSTAKIRDTQCGFKLFSRTSLPYIIPYMHSEGWIFDVEMLMLAEFAGIPVAEVPVGWKEVQGSKLNVIWDSLGMAWGLAILRAAWGFGVYRRSRT